MGTFDLCDKLIKANDAQDAMRIQSEFFQAQLRATTEQAKSMNYPLGDAISGLFGAFAIATALAERNALPREEQKGVEIDLSATEAMIRLLDPLAAEHVTRSDQSEPLTHGPALSGSP